MQFRCSIGTEQQFAAAFESSHAPATSCSNCTGVVMRLHSSSSSPSSSPPPARSLARLNRSCSSPAQPQRQPSPVFVCACVWCGECACVRRWSMAADTVVTLGDMSSIGLFFEAAGGYKLGYRHCYGGGAFCVHDLTAASEHWATFHSLFAALRHKNVATVAADAACAGLVCVLRILSQALPSNSSSSSRSRSARWSRLGCSLADRKRSHRPLSQLALRLCSVPLINMAHTRMRHCAISIAASPLCRHIVRLN